MGRKCRVTVKDSMALIEIADVHEQLTSVDLPIKILVDGTYVGLAKDWAIYIATMIELHSGSNVVPIGVSPAFQYAKKKIETKIIA